MSHNDQPHDGQLWPRLEEFFERFARADADEIQAALLAHDGRRLAQLLELSRADLSALSALIRRAARPDMSNLWPVPG